MKSRKSKHGARLSRIEFDIEMERIRLEERQELEDMARHEAELEDTFRRAEQETLWHKGRK